MKKGEIWTIELPSPEGHEQTGIRPALILSEPEANTVIIVPFTSNIQALRFLHTTEIEPTEENGLPELSIALVFQVRAIDKKRLKEKLGQLELNKQKEIDVLLKTLMKL